MRTPQQTFSSMPFPSYVPCPCPYRHRNRPPIGLPAHLSRETGLTLAEHGVDEAAGAEAHRVVDRKAGLRLRLRDRRTRAVLVERARVQRDRDDARRPRRERRALVQLHELAERRDRVRPAADALDLLPPGLVTEDEPVRHAAVEEAERDARVDRVDERALALDPEDVSPTLVPLDDEPLGRAG